MKLSGLTVLAALALGVAAQPATAGEAPACPCWSNSSLLAWVSKLGPAAACDSHPATLQDQGQVGQIAAIVGPNEPYYAWYQIEAYQEIGADVSYPPVCSIAYSDVALPPKFITKREFWRCVNDITKLCRDLGAPPID